MKPSLYLRNLFILVLAIIGWAPVTGGDLPPVKLPVNVANSDGSPRLDLRSSNFRLRVDGRPTPQEGFLDAEAPTMLILALDTTGDRTYIEALRQELIRFTANLPQGIHVLVLNINGGLRIVQDHTRDAALLRQAILNYDITGFPGFLENAREVAVRSDRMFQRNPIRVATVFITDSNIQAYKRRFSATDLTNQLAAIKHDLLATTAPIYTLRLPVQIADPDVIRTADYRDIPLVGGTQPGVGAGSEESTSGELKARMSARDAGNEDRLARTYEGVIREISTSIGGDAQFPLNLTGVSTALTSILHRIHGTYILVFPRPDVRAGGEVKIEVETVDAAGRKLDLKLNYRRTLALP